MHHHHHGDMVVVQWVWPLHTRACCDASHTQAREVRDLLKYGRVGEFVQCRGDSEMSEGMQQVVSAAYTKFCLLSLSLKV